MRPARGSNTRRRTRGQQHGFAYLFLLFALAVVGLLLGAFGQNWRTTAQRERETELLFIGKQFAAALASYRACSQGGPNAPATLEDLLEDKRFPFPVRHLRQIARDPMTGKRDWDLQIADGRIIGVRSNSTKLPIRRALPDHVALLGEAGATASYHDWLFVSTQNSPADAAGKCPTQTPRPTAPGAAD